MQRQVNVGAILQYTAHVVTQSAVESSGGGEEEADFLRARIILDLLIELCAAPEQPQVKDVAKFMASLISASPDCCRVPQVAMPLYVLCSFHCTCVQACVCPCVHLRV